MATVVKMPQLAAGEETATVQAWLVEVGDSVEEGQPIVEVETEKATVDYEAEAAGVFAGALVEAGATVAVGSAIAVIATEGEDVVAALEEHSADSTGSAPVPNGPSGPTTAPAAPSDERREDTCSDSGSIAVDDHVRRFASPLARRIAKEQSIPLANLHGSGPGGRIVRRDVEAHLSSSHTPSAQAAPRSDRSVAEAPASSPANFADVPHSGMRRAIARRLAESKSTVPHFYLVADVHVDALLALRQQVNAAGDAKVSINDFIIKAVAKALQDVPHANAIWTEEATRRFSGVDIAVAVSVPGGLLTPVLRSVETLVLTDISTQMRDFAARARDGRIKQSELVGGAFSISNLGMYGTQEFSAILNPPQAGILAVGAAAKRPVVDAKGELSVATVMRVTLSADHRVLDGAVAAEWLAAFVRRVEHPLTMLI